MFGALLTKLVSFVVLVLPDRLTLGILFRILPSCKNAPLPSSSKEFLHSLIIPSATYSPWESEEEFKSIYSRIEGNTLVDIYRCYDLWQLSKNTSRVNGDIVEVGVWKGGSGALLAKAAELSNCGKIVYLADTFSGVVKAGEHDTRYKGGEHSDAIEKDVENLVESLGLNNVRILKGIFPNDTGGRLAQCAVSFLHIDVDVYQSARETFEWMRERLSVGAIVVFDDYGFRGCEGVTKYVNELRSDQDFHHMHNLNGHAVLIKMR